MTTLVLLPTASVHSDDENKGLHVLFLGHQGHGFIAGPCPPPDSNTTVPCTWDSTGFDNPAFRFQNLGSETLSLDQVMFWQEVTFGGITWNYTLIEKNVDIPLQHGYQLDIQLSATVLSTEMNITITFQDHSTITLTVPLSDVLLTLTNLYDTPVPISSALPSSASHLSSASVTTSLGTVASVVFFFTIYMSLSGMFIKRKKH